MSARRDFRWDRSDSSRRSGGRFLWTGVSGLLLPLSLPSARAPPDARDKTPGRPARTQRPSQTQECSGRRQPADSAAARPSDRDSGAFGVA